MKQVFLVLAFISLFLCYHYAEVYMHEQTHYQTAINYGCEAEIELQSVFFAHTSTSCPNLSSTEFNQMRLAFSIQESYYPNFVFYRFIVFFILLSGYLFVSRRI